VNGERSQESEFRIQKKRRPLSRAGRKGAILTPDSWLPIFRRDIKSRGLLRRYFRAVTVISMWAAGDASFTTPTVVRAGRGSAKYLV